MLTLHELGSTRQPLLTLDTRFIRAVRSFAEVGPKSLESKRQWVERTPGMDEPMTVASRADELYVSVFYKLVVASMLVRAIDAQLEATPSDELVSARDELRGHLDEWLQLINDSLDYSPIPVQTLVSVQYGTMLAVLNNL